MARKKSAPAREPLPGERKVRVHCYLPPETLADLDRITAELPRVTSRNAAVEYLVELYKAREAVRAAKGLKGPVPLYEPIELIV